MQRDNNKSPQHISAGQKTMRQVKHRRQPQVNVIQVSTGVRAHQVRDGKIQGERIWQCRKSKKVTTWIMFEKPWRDFPADTITCFKKLCKIHHIAFLHFSCHLLAVFLLLTFCSCCLFYFKFQFQSLTPDDHWSCEDIVKMGIHLG